MSEHIVKSFHDQLEALDTAIVQMGGLCEKQLSDAIDAISRRDVDLAQRIVGLDTNVDAYETQIEQQVIRLLALRQPLATDLRETLAGLKISADLERIGDLAKNVAKRALVVSNEVTDQNLIQGLVRMGRLALAQLKDVLDAYVKRDVDIALRVWKCDGEIDEIYNSLFRELLTYMMEDPRKISPSTHLLFIAKNFERIGDHATNIAETVSYIVTGSKMGDPRPKSDTTSTTSISAAKDD
ncbi:MAG: phosphate signaling complex protein PhoU [Micropepsaceae bacterium]